MRKKFYSWIAEPHASGQYAIFSNTDAESCFEIVRCLNESNAETGVELDIKMEEKRKRDEHQEMKLYGDKG